MAGHFHFGSVFHADFLRLEGKGMDAKSSLRASLARCDCPLTS